MNRLYLIFIPIIVISIGCSNDKKTAEKLKKIEEIQKLIKESNFEAARIAAVDTLDEEIKSLYYKADDNLGHASHLDVRCNERIAEILYDIVKKIPAKDVKINRYIYSKLLNMYPENQIYKNKSIHLPR